MVKFNEKNFCDFITGVVLLIGVACVHSNDTLINNINNGVNVTEYRGELCTRTCVKGEKRICYFKWTMEQYQAMGVACGRCAQGVEKDCNHPQCITVDGNEKGVLSINRQIPGPSIQVCKDDLVVVDVVNAMAGESSTIHWHGLHQRDTPYMDGVPFVTQCPIEYSTTFRYSFWATEPGTQFYHSHSGHQKVNGHYGAFIIREPPGTDPNSYLYDHDLPEHVILMSDWMQDTAEMFAAGLPTRGIGTSPASVLINGRGQYIDPKTGKRTKAPLTKYEVEPNKRYRFRTINSASLTCPLQLQVESHRLTVIATDATNVEPKVFDTLISNAGERYDFILDTNQPPGDYLIRLTAIGGCISKAIETFAILTYTGGKSSPGVPRSLPSYTNPFPTGILLNHPNATCFENRFDICVNELKSYERDDNLRLAEPEYRYFLGFKNYLVPPQIMFRPGTYNHFTNVRKDMILIGGINNLSLKFPSFPLLTQPEHINQTRFCDDRGNKPLGCTGQRVCQCIHLIKIPLNAIVEFIIVDEAPGAQTNHPFHLHGFKFMITDMGQSPLEVPLTVELAKSLYKVRALHATPFNLKAPFKDTVSVPSGGYSVLRLRADNPGFWLLHCHYEWHMATGMGLVFQVGEVEDMVKAPKDFPKCGNFLPNLSESDLKKVSSS